MANFLDFTSDRINVFMILVDASASMRHEAKKVRRGLENLKKSLKDFSEAGSIAISISRFNHDFYKSDFKPIFNIDTSYSADGTTALYYAINRGADVLKYYMDEIISEKHCNPRAYFILLSDGVSEGSDISEKKARNAIEKLNYLGVTTIFVPFGDVITSEFGIEMGFLSVSDEIDKSSLDKFFGVDLSRSIKEQSISRKSLGKNFWSKAANPSLSDAYSHRTQQALEDDSWIEDI